MSAITGIIAKPLGYLLYFLYGIFDNYAITLIVFTCIVRLCMVPLSVHQLKSTSRMQEIQPKIQALQKKYANDQETMNIKMQELYKEEKFNPMGGCLPLLIQFPIIIGLFSLLRNPTMYIESPEMLMAIHESFFWVSDLSQPDTWILPLAAALATYFSTAFQGASPEGAAGSSMKMMKYFLPLMILLMGRSFPAGITIYWFFGTCFQIVQSIIMKKFKKKDRDKKDQDKKKTSKKK